jgi:hypothetical protein
LKTGGEARMTEYKKKEIKRNRRKKLGKLINCGPVEVIAVWRIG